MESELLFRWTPGDSLLGTDKTARCRCPNRTFSMQTGERAQFLRHLDDTTSSRLQLWQAKEKNKVLLNSPWNRKIFYWPSKKRALKWTFQRHYIKWALMPGVYGCLDLCCRLDAKAGKRLWHFQHSNATPRGTQPEVSVVIKNKNINSDMKEEGKVAGLPHWPPPRKRHSALKFRSTSLRSR